MQANRKEFVKTLGRGLVEGLLVLPIILALTILLAGEAFIFAVVGLLYGLFVVAYLVRKLLPEKRLLAFILAGLFVVVSLFFIGGWLAKIMLLLLGTVVTFRGIQHAENDWKDILPVSFLWGAGISIYFVMYLVFHFMDRLSDYTAMVGNAGLVFLIITMLLTNRRHLEKEASIGKQKKQVNSTIKRLNDVFLFGTVAVVLLLTNFSVVQSAIYHTLRSLIQSFIWLVELFGGDESSDMEPTPPEQAAPVLPMDENVEPSALAAFLDMLAIAFGMIMAIVLVLLALSIFVKKVRHFIKSVFLWIWHTIRKVFTRRSDLETASEYADEKESLFDWKKWRQERQQAMKQRWQRWTKVKPRWDKMNPAEQVRYLVRTTIDEVKQAGKWRNSFTVREIMHFKQDASPEIKEWYNQVRYGDGSLSPEEEEQLRIKREEFYREER